MANIMQTALTISGAKENIEKIAKLILTTDEWMKQLEERNNALSEDFRVMPAFDPLDKTYCPIDFNRLISTPTDIFQGNLGTKEKEKYGEKNWYDWNYKNWGTKWNAYDTIVTQTDKDIYIEMDTAWNVPTPYLKKLAELCVEHDCHICGVYADEDYWSENMGRIDLENGELVITEEPSADLYEDVWGFNPEEED